MAEDARAFADGAKAFFCTEVGFISFVEEPGKDLRSPQRPAARVQYGDGLIVMSEPFEINGMRSVQSSYLSHGVERAWVYTGYRGTLPVSDTCTDITSDIAGSFVDLALATSWGMAEVERRIALFDALEDDLRTRLDLAERERDALATEAKAAQADLDGLETELATARMAICEIAKETHGLLTQASFKAGAAPPAGFAELVAEASTMSECIEGTTMTVGTAQDR